MRLSENPGCNPICRACHYKNLDYGEQLSRKRAWAERQLGHWGESLRDIRPAPETERLGYRAKSWLRSHVQAGEVSFGMVRAVQGESRWEKEFVSWNTCPLHTEGIRETTERLRTVLSERLPDFSANALFGVWFGTPHVVLIAREGPLEALRRLPWSEILVAPLMSASFHQTNQVGKSTFGEGPIVPLYESDSSLNSSSGSAPIRAFRQIARTLLVEARGAAVKALLQDPPKLVLDLYCGTGEIARLLPGDVGWIGVESSKEAVAYAREIRPGGAARHEVYLGLIEDRLRDPRVIAPLCEKYGLFINPPRPGLGEGGRALLTEIIAGHRPSSVVYLSCSASSLARDLTALTASGFRVESLQPYDFFPQTEHFETLAVLR